MARLSSIPEPHSVIHEPIVSGAEDAHGNPVESWGPPETVAVYGWATPGSDQETRPELTGVKRDLDLYSRTPFAGPRDRVTVAGELFAVVGYPENYNFGPFRFTPGCRINLRRVEG